MKASPRATDTPAAVTAGHTRLHRSFLAAAEKRALIWMAERMPARVNPDHLSALGLVSMAGAGAAFWLAGSQPAAGVPLVVVCLALNWFGDSLDGTLARVRNRQRPRYGFYVDHVIDMAGTAMMLAGLALSGHMSPLIAAVTLAAWLLVMGESFLGTWARSLFRMSFLGFGPTELRILIAAGALMLLGGGLVRPFGLGPYRLFDVAGLFASAGLAVVFIVNAVRNTIALHREEARW
ncbi:MAG: CDP-alcohol phosphatidyltransferase family protein [Vicinamibacterales bacterium]